MTFDKLYPVIRTILGDEQIHGMWNYSDDMLESAVTAVFLLGRGPAGYALNNDQTEIIPDPQAGDLYALICYEACLLRIGGEDGAMRTHTREVSVLDEGHRKRDLLLELKQQIYDIRDGAAVFSTFQNFEQFVNTLRSGSAFPLNLAQVEVTSAPGNINI